MKKSAILLFAISAFLTTALALTGFTDPPSSFDLRNVGGENYVSSVKSQQGGTCWTHGAMAAIEGDLMMTGNWTAAGETGEPNLAEYHLDWWNGFNEHNNDDIDPPWGDGLEVHYGGDYRVTSAYLARGEGAVRDIDGQSYDNPPDRYDPSYHYYYPRDIEWFVAGSNLENIDTIKNHIMTEGVMGTCMCYDDGFIDYDYCHYQPPSSLYDPNHAIAIVGWDDHKNTPAPQDGAWLCKNSWSGGWGHDGYFWISYYDKHSCQHPEMGAISFQDTELMQYDWVYYHDYHGWRDTMADCFEVFNAFTAAGGGDCVELVRAVNFFTAEDDVSYMIKIYDTFTNGELVDELASQSGYCDYTGFHTVDLNSPAAIGSGEDFYVYLALSAGGQPYDRTSEVPVLLGMTDGTIVESSANPQESYYRIGADWEDLYYYDDPPWTHTANFCVKALSTFAPYLEFSYPMGLPELVDPDGGTTFRVEVSGIYADPEPGTGMLHYSTGGNFISIPLEVVSDNIYDAVFPEIYRGTDISYFVSARTTDGITVCDPFDAPDETYQTFSATGKVVIYQDDFSTNLGWSGLGGEAEWTIGPATGGTGDDTHGGPDPSEDCSPTPDNQVLGNDLTPGSGGDYERYISDTKWIVSPGMDCTGYFGVTLNFQRWLGVESNEYDHAYLAGHDGSSWTTIFENGSNTIDERAWQGISSDISDLADGNPNLRIRFGLGSTDQGWEYCGWNVDDLEVVGYTWSPEEPITINLIPDDPPVVVPPGGSFTYTGIVENHSAQPLTGDVWVMVRLPDDTLYGPVVRYDDIPLASGRKITKENISQIIPPSAPEETYEYIAYVGDFEETVIDSSSFAFTIAAP